MIRPSACASDSVMLRTAPRPSACASDSVKVDADVADVTDGFRPMPPVEPPPEHLRRWELTPKMGSGLAKQMNSPPAKRGRYE